MTKKGPLGKAERFYIENHLDQSLDDLAKDLDRPKGTIKKYIEKLPVDDKQKAGTLLYQQFARNKKGSTIMTRGASELGDELRSMGVDIKRTRPGCITNVRNT